MQKCHALAERGQKPASLHVVKRQQSHPSIGVAPTDAAHWQLGLVRQRAGGMIRVERPYLRVIPTSALISACNSFAKMEQGHTDNS
jgi:hypothetical protein